MKNNIEAIKMATFRAEAAATNVVDEVVADIMLRVVELDQHAS